MKYFGYFTKEGMNDFIDFITQQKEDIPDDKILVDSHSHFGTYKTFNEQDFVNLIFNKNVKIQTLSGWHPYTNKNLLTLSKLKEAKLKPYTEILFQDDYAMVLKQKDETRIVTQSTEFETYLGNHGIHIVIEGHEKFEPDGTYELLNWAENKHDIIIAHPFSLPHPKLKFLPPNKKQKNNLEKITKEFDVMMEGLNSMNSLWMTPTNGLVRKFAKEENIPLIYNTDSHPSPNIYMVSRQLGKAGTLIPDFDWKGLTGKEIIQKKNELVKTCGEKYGSTLDWYTFGRVMILKR